MTRAATPGAGGSLVSCLLERSTFGTSPRFNDDSAVIEDVKQRPHAYRGFTPLLDVTKGRAVSEVGTFSSGDRKALFGSATVDVAFYEYPTTAKDLKKHSRGVKRTEGRFHYQVDECSPGPIYKPYENPSAGSGTKFSRAPRFTSPSPQPYGVTRSTSVSQQGGRGDVDKSRANSKKQCTFGIRHENVAETRGADSKSPPLVPLLGPTDPTTLFPPYSGKFSSSERTSAFGHGRANLTPGPGHFLKTEFVAESPKWTFGRFRKPAASTTPGPGAYRIDKYKPFNKPRGETFPRIGHIPVMNPAGRDSPGPALYSTVHFPEK